MKVLITFLFLGICLFGFGQNYSVEPEMGDSTTYEVTCHGSQKTIRCCSLLKQNDGGGYDTKRSWLGSSNCVGGENTGDIYAKMVIDTVNMAAVCKATISSKNYKGSSISFESWGWQLD